MGLKMNREIVKEEPIDIVITWVDGSDKEWLAEKNKYLNNDRFDTDTSINRYRDWDNLQYLFRGIEKFSPWVRTVHLVTWGHIPPWLNISCEKLNIVNHKDFIPSKFLPLFNSSSIEMQFHRIKDLSNNFIYFNDDMFLTSQVKPDDFFVNGKPLYEGFLNNCSSGSYNDVMPYIVFNNIGVINSYFKKTIVIRSNPGSWFNWKYPVWRNVVNLFYLTIPLFPGFKNHHLPTPLRKSDYIKVWDTIPGELDLACKSKFRSKTDFNQYLIRNWAMVEGDFTPSNYRRKGSVFFDINKDIKEIIKTIENPRNKMICINDGVESLDFEKKKILIHQAFDTILPNKSNFEI